MVLYRRNYIAGGTFFFTVALRDRRSDLLFSHADLSKQVFAEIKTKRPFSIEAMVVMPEHLHAIWTLPQEDSDYSGRWRAIKSSFVRALTRHGIAVARNARGEADVWQRRFWEHTIRDENDFNRHVDYIHYNPVKHGHVKCPSHWPHSSIHRFIEQGMLPVDWGASLPPDQGNYGDVKPGCRPQGRNPGIFAKGRSRIPLRCIRATCCLATARLFGSAMDQLATVLSGTDSGSG